MKETTGEGLMITEKFELVAQGPTVVYVMIYGIPVAEVDKVISPVDAFRLKPAGEDANVPPVKPVICGNGLVVPFTQKVLEE